jgi:hypothetical protein
MNEWRNDQWSMAVQSLDPEDQSLWKVIEPVKRVSTPSPPLITLAGIALSDSEMPEALAEGLETHFQPVNDPLEPIVNENVNKAMRAYFFTLATEPKLTNFVEIQDVILGLKVGNAPGPNGIFPSGRQPSLSRYSIRLSALSTSYKYGSMPDCFPSLNHGRTRRCHHPMVP